MKSILRALRGRCPNCGEGPLFATLFQLHETCPRCAVRHERWPGTWTIASWISASLGITFGALLATGLYLHDALEMGTEWPIVAGSCLVALASYRPIKAATFGACHAIGMVHPDPVQVGNVIYLKRYREQRKRDPSDDDHAAGNASVS
ncbi:MAG: hypothetical protein H6739_07370 [Alphaproteobacteria bacterium]|nr:hypothetical protein [Alphaproteobacteria bacterium]